jgi:hypothetical protein
MRWVWLVVWAVEFIAAMVAIPVGIAMVVLGNDNGWYVMLVAVALIDFWAVQYFLKGKDPEPIL